MLNYIHSKRKFLKFNNRVSTIIRKYMDHTKLAVFMAQILLLSSEMRAGLAGFDFRQVKEICLLP